MSGFQADGGRVRKDYESVAVSTRIRLARNFKDYLFPERLLLDPNAAQRVEEMIRIVKSNLNDIDDFTFYDMRRVSDETAEFLIERRLISRDLMRHRELAAAFVYTTAGATTQDFGKAASFARSDEEISVMVNEEDHLREQYFVKGFDLKRAYERIYGIDEAIADPSLMARDPKLGYLTACPTNVGTGLRASVMMFLPALSRKGFLEELMPNFAEQGLTVRGALGEGSEALGDLYQISNEVTFGYSEDEILKAVEARVDDLVEFELRERELLLSNGGVALEDRIFRSLGILTNCRTIGLREFILRIADLKLGVALGIIEGDEADDVFGDLEDLVTEMRPANVNRLHGKRLTEDEQNIFRAECASKKIRKMNLHD